LTVQLEIRDGNPDWWASLDIWVVPGTDPTAPAGPPVAGRQAYLWAHVQNHGSDAAVGVRVDFWWADPSLQVLRSTAHLIGSANVDVPAGGAEDVLCLVPWMVTSVNGGHECVVAVANHAGSSVPSPPPDDFAPTVYPEVAQRNLTVLPAQAGMQTLMLVIAGRARTEKSVLVTAETGGHLGDEALRRLGLEGRKPAGKQALEVGLRRERGCVPAEGPVGHSELELHVQRKTSDVVHLAVRARELSPHEYAVVRVVEREGDTTLGGYSYVVVSEPQGAER
jgi:hypothetical protein